MQKPRNTNLPADLPENWQIDQDITPIGTDAGLTEQHGYNYQSKQINEAHKAINELNDAFLSVQKNLETLTTDTTVVDGDTFVAVKANNTKRRFSFVTLVNAIKTKLNSVYAALVHTHGNISNDGKIGSTSGQAVMTTDGGTMIAGTLPVSGGGTGAATAAAARTNLGITPANIGAAPTSHNHNATNINAGTLAADRLPIVPVTKGGTGATDLVITKLKRGISSDTLTQVYLSPSGVDTADGLTASTPMKTIRAAVGRYGGLNRLQLNLAAGTYADSAAVTISGSQYVNITSTPETVGSVVITHPIIFQSCDAKLFQVTFDLSASSLTSPTAAVTLRQAKYDIQTCVFKVKTTGVAAGVNVSLGSSGYLLSCNFQAGRTAAEIGSGASMTAIQCAIAAALTIGFDTNGGLLISSNNTNSATTQFTMYNSSAIFNNGILLNQAANVVAAAEVI